MLDIRDYHLHCAPHPCSRCIYLVLDRNSRLFYLLCPKHCHCSPSSGFRLRYVSSVLPVRLSGAHSAILRIVAGLWHSGAFTSRVSFEVGWLSYLCVMWLATGSETAGTLGGITGCGGDSCMCHLPPPRYIDSNCSLQSAESPRRSPRLVSSIG